MSITAKFKGLVHDLDDETLREVQSSIAREIGARQPESAIRFEDIHPRMTDVEKEQAAQEIARLLKEGL
jgi:hypothetical protein